MVRKISTSDPAVPAFTVLGSGVVAIYYSIRKSFRLILP